MPEKWKSSLTLVAILGMIAMAIPAAYAGVPDVTQSFYVPQAGNTTTPLEGLNVPNPSYRFFRACPNNDGGASLPNNARVKVVVRDVNGTGIAGIAAADVCLLFNGGTPLQGFSGVGADSVIANSQYNQIPLCPDVRCVQADAETDATGTTFITFTGSTAGSPGVGTRNGLRKWGHYDTEIPVYVLGFRISGRLTTTSANGTYALRIKNFDYLGGLGTAQDVGEVVDTEFANFVFNVGNGNALSYWRDFNYTCLLGVGGCTGADNDDFATLVFHITHGCNFPNNP